LTVFTISAFIFLGAITPSHAQNESDESRVIDPFKGLYNYRLSPIKKTTCEKPPKAPRRLNFTSVYTDKSQGTSIIDPKAQKLYKEQISEIELYEKKIMRWVEDILNNRLREESFCVLEWMEIWANDKAFLTDDMTFQGESTRKWFLAVIATHYLHLQRHVNIPDEQRFTIKRWIRRIADQVVEDYNSYPDSNSRNNNHMYWSAWGVMAASAISHNKEHYYWALEQGATGIERIEENGVLPNELSRQRRAFVYHNFAAAPLVMMAEMAYQNGDDLYAHNEGALHNLVALIVSEARNGQEKFAELTGHEQDNKGIVTNYGMAWLEVYNSRFYERKAERILKKLRPLKSRRTGGNMTLLFRD